VTVAATAMAVVAEVVATSGMLRQLTADVLAGSIRQKQSSLQ
jgi:hypothetical protein